ncbi:MAG: GxxExxY protein [Longimicrobiales bacterium]
MQINQLSEQIIGAAIAIHRELGPGLLESAYEACMVYELTMRGLGYERQKLLSVMYGDRQIDCGYRVDLLVATQIVVELKAVERLDPIHTAQMLTYLKLSGCHLGLLINFNVPVLRNGIRRLVLGLREAPRPATPRR